MATKPTRKQAPKRTRPKALFVRLTSAEAAKVRAYADRLGVPVSIAARLILLDAADRDAALPRPPGHNP
jgi:hypothetical protein